MNKTGDAATVSDGEGLIQSTQDFRGFWNEMLAWIASHYFNIAVACVIAALIVALLYGVRALGTRLCRRRHIGHWPRIIGRAIARTNLFFTVMVAARIVSGYAEAPAMVADTVRFLFIVATAIQAALWVREILIGLAEHRAGDAEGSPSTLGSAIGIIRVLVTAICFIIATLLILDNVGVNITGLVASLGIGGIAIGLAAKDVFADLFASLAIIFDKPFRRGDTIKWDNTTGTVEAIGLKTTRVRAATGEEVVISNTNLLNKELHNHASIMRRRATLMLQIIYQTPPELCRRLPDIVKEIVTKQEKSAFLHCAMVNFGTSSLDYELVFDVIDGNGEVFNHVRHEICIAILETFAREGIEFAYPTQTTFTAAPDGTMIMPYSSAPEISSPANMKAKPATKHES